MKKKMFKYQLLSWVLLLAMSPSLIGVNIFKHHCFSCNEFETVATIMKVDHEHKHTHGEVEACCCSHNTISCCKGISSNHDHFSDKCCSEEYKRINVDVTVFNSILKFKVAEFELLHQFDINQKSLLVAETYKNYSFQNVIVYIPDEPSLTKNCTFLL